MVAIVHRESRSRIGIIWFDNEEEAKIYARDMPGFRPEAIAEANLGIQQCGRDPGFDRPGMYAVVTP